MSSYFRQSCVQRKTHLRSCGALLLLSIVSNGPAQQPEHCSSMLLPDLAPCLFNGPQLSPTAIMRDTISGDRIFFGGSYFDLVQDKMRDNAGTISSVNSDAASATAYATMQRTSWTLLGWWDWSGMDFAWSDRADDLRADGRSTLQEAGIGIGNRIGRVTTDAAVWLTPAGGDGNARHTVSRVLGTSCSFSWNSNSFSAVFFADRAPSLASLSRIETQSDATGRDFPFYFIRTRAGIPVSFRLGPVTAGITPDFTRLVSDTTAQPPDKLNTVLGANGGSLLLWTKTAHAPLPVSVECSVRKWYLTATGYDGTTMYATVDNGELLDGWSEVFVDLPHRVRAGLFGELTDGNVPQGYFEAFPFTSWTIFDPVHYKITRLWGVVHEAGLFAQSNFRVLRCSEIDAGADCSFLYGNFVFGTRERKIEILIPYYTDESVMSAENKYVLLKLRLGYGLDLGKYSFHINALQLVPFELRRGQQNSSEQPTSLPPQVSHSTYGGLRLTFSASIHF
jgi:hypothetical protein